MSNRSEAKQRLELLKQQLTDYSYKYYIMDSPEVDDAVYDGLMNELKSIELQYPELITADSPSQRVGGQAIEAFRSMPHMQRMLSLNDVFSDEEVYAWIARISKLNNKVSTADFWADIKMDGLACAIYYQDGNLDVALTRGDGTIGEDVTHNIRTIASIPFKMRGKNLSVGRVGVRGEIIMHKSELTRINKERQEKGLALYANPRNLAAGTIRQLNPKLTAQRKLYFRAFDIFSDSRKFSTNAEVYRLLKEAGFNTNIQARQYDSIDDVLEFAHSWEKDRSSLAFDTDGLVIKLNDRMLYSDLGVVGKNPRGAVAYKYPAEQTTTIVKDIFISIGRTGAATPVAMLDAVVVSGSTVQMATLHNEGEIKRKDIRVGDTVVIQKAGDIIPEVVEPIVKLRTGKEEPFVMPSHCPECNTKLIKAKADEAIWRCPNSACPARSQKHIEHFASKGALDIEGLGEKNVHALLESKLISDQADIYTLTPEQLLTLDRFAAISANKLVNAIQSKKKPPLAKFLFGLGIRHIGVQTAIDLANHFRSIEAIEIANIDQLADIDGVGDVVAEATVAWFSDPSNRALLQKFKTLGVWPEENKQSEGPLKGLRFVITGSLETMGRELAAEKVRLLGGVFQSSLGKDTDYLVVGKNVGASKLKKASSYGTKQITEEALLKMINV
jgi:DNA ligase (NAD+)